MSGPVFIPDLDDEAVQFAITTAINVTHEGIACRRCGSPIGTACYDDEDNPHKARQVDAVLAVLAEVGVPAQVGWGVRTPDGREIPFITEAGANGAAVIGDQPRTVLRRFVTEWEAAS